MTAPQPRRRPPPVLVTADNELAYRVRELAAAAGVAGVALGASRLALVESMVAKEISRIVDKRA